VENGDICVICLHPFPGHEPECPLYHDDICKNYHRGNQESYEASDATRKERDRRRIRAALEGARENGATCDELEVLLTLAHQTASARCSELLKDDVVRRKRDSNGKKIRRLTRRGCWAAVLILKEFVPRFEQNGQGTLF
jgi:hypothetical protein